LNRRLVTALFYQAGIFKRPLSEFAFFAAAAPTALEPAPEPDVVPLMLYLPAVMSGSSGVTRQASDVTDDASRVTDALYLPMMNR